jgi:hypothetical protein
MRRPLDFPPMPSVNDLRKHVFDDAMDLAAITGMLVPIVEVDFGRGVEAELHPVRFIRQQLMLSFALIVTRMHDDSPDGKTGTTASIKALLLSAAEAGRISKELCASYLEALQNLRAAYDQQGGNFEELRRFRHAELAHSLHPRAPLERLLLMPLWDLAHETFELVASLEPCLDQSGMESMYLQNRFEL